MNFDKNTYTLQETGPLARKALSAGIVGVVLSLIGAFMDRAQFFQAYLTAFTFLTTISLGGLFFVLIHHVTGAYWGLVLRRVAENLACTLPLMGLFAIPLFFGMHDLFHWTHLDDPHVAHDAILQWKSPYLNTPFFVIRTVLYFGIWTYLAHRLKMLSKAQDKGDRESLGKMRRLSAGGVVLYAITVTGFGFDWLMSLDPHWYSTIFGVYTFSGGFWAALAFLFLITAMLQKSGAGELVTTEHAHDLAKFMFAFTAWWAYIGGAQYFLIWYGNIPEETIWYLHRWEHGWKPVSLFLLAFHFIVPFFILAFRAAKRVPLLMSAVSALFLFMHYVDHFWLVNPTFNDHHFQLSWMHVAAVLGVGGIYFWRFISISGKDPIIVRNDPNYEKSVKHKI